jgi:predicted NBD/HSP70 family sugar kinase
MPVESSRGPGAELRARNLRAVLGALRATPRLSRAELAARTGLSKPTVGSALRALEDAGLVCEAGRTTGRRGPSASLHEVVADAVLVLGLGIGAGRVRAVAADLAGDVHDEIDVPLDRADAEHVIAAMTAVRERLGDPRVELAVAGSPGVLDPRSGRIRSSPTLAGWEGAKAEAVLRQGLGVPTLVENDVNLAALGELARGAGRGRSSFAYLSVGAGLGAGLVLGGRLHRGRHGAAGEVGYLAVGPDPMGEARPDRGPMEARLSDDAVADIARRLGPDVPRDPGALYALARQGDPLAAAAVQRIAEAIAVCVASITAVVDLELVLLGGAIGAHDDLLLDPVRTATAALVPYAPDIAAAELGERAVLVGAAALGAERALAATVGRLVARPTPG